MCSNFYDWWIIAETDIWWDFTTRDEMKEGIKRGQPMRLKWDKGV